MNELFENIENKDGFYAYPFNLADSLAQTSGYYGIFFIAIKPCEVIAANEVHGAAGTSSTVTIEKLTGTTAKGSGTAITSALSTASTANTVQNFVFVAGTTQLDIGDRLAIKPAGDKSNLLNMFITVYLKPLGKGDYR